MTLPLYDNGLLSGLFLGLLFGFALEAAGFGSPRRLTGQFLLRDWSVFKVMFTAVIVAALGLWLFQTLGWLGPGSYFVPGLLLYGTFFGGVLIGVGFMLGGYCPGTSAVGLASGRIDALVFMIGMVAGSAVYAAVFDWIRPFALATAGPGGWTLPQLFGVPDIVVIAALAVIAFLGWKLGTAMERRLGGPYRAEQILEDVDGLGTGGARMGGAERLHPAE
ncbi:hypothetical protein HRbin39_00942 [bacterium HR39]|nr:hypothetical protein HRbin39_00942 [bacterium HR39]